MGPGELPALQLPKGAYVSLIADGKANELYAQYDFKPVAPKSMGMARIF